MTTEDEIWAEHQAALDSLNQSQRRALARITRARQLATFRNESWRQTIKVIIAREARRREARVKVRQTSPREAS